MSSVAYSVSVQSADFDVNQELQLLRQSDCEIGAQAVFVGSVRGNNPEDPVSGMLLEHYPGMTEKSIGKIIVQASERWQLISTRVIHRVGYLRPGDQIVFVAVCSRHRGDAFAACEFIMDYLKTRAPFWKKETTVDGERWVEARDSDRDAAARW